MVSAWDSAVSGRDSQLGLKAKTTVGFQGRDLLLGLKAETSAVSAKNWSQAEIGPKVEIFSFAFDDIVFIIIHDTLMFIVVFFFAPLQKDYSDNKRKL